MRDDRVIPHFARRLAAVHCVWAATMVLAAPAPLLAQTATQLSQPYAVINRSRINYAGPGREKRHDLSGPEIKIGLILPLSGARKAEGEALLAAARLAIEDEAATPMPAGFRLALAPRDESGLWGRASSEIVRLVVDDRAIALITSPDGRAAHLAEQVGNRLGVPVLSLASDSQNTQINIPWYFRMVPDDAAQARLFAEDIYRRRSFQNVLLISDADHDGKVGRQEFEKAGRRLNAPPPTVIELPVPLTIEGFPDREIAAREWQALVVWSGAENAARIFAAFKAMLDRVEAYVCHKAAQPTFIRGGRAEDPPKFWIAVTEQNEPGKYSDAFDTRLRERAGIAPHPATREMYDAVRLIAAGVRAAGPNRARVRDSIAALGPYRGISGLISFDGAGNNQATVALIRLK